MIHRDLANELFNDVERVIRETGDNRLIYELNTIRAEFIYMRETIKRLRSAEDDGR